MSEIYEKMVKEALAAQRADVDTVNKNRGGKFKITDTKAYLDVVNQMTVADGQIKSVINLHVDSVNIHYNTRRFCCKFPLRDDCRYGSGYYWWTRCNCTISRNRIPPSHFGRNGGNIPLDVSHNGCSGR